MSVGEIRTKRWNDPIEPTDGTRILVCRYRPRGVAKADETWSEWLPDLGPTVKLHAAAYGKSGLKIDWNGYRCSYLREMAGQSLAIEALAQRVAAGETITLLCSTQCVRARVQMPSKPAAIIDCRQASIIFSAMKLDGRLRGVVSEKRRIHVQQPMPLKRK